MFEKVNTPADWLYKIPKLNLSKLPIMQKELLQIFELSKNFSMVPYTSTYWDSEVVDVTKMLLEQCPAVNQQARIMGLSIAYLAFISVTHDKVFPAHIDGPVNVALNIPLINCDGTYTVWFDGKIGSNKINQYDYTIGNNGARSAIAVDEDSLTEIGRIESNVPLWLNVSKIHRPVTTHKNFRVAASLRFDPEPLDQQGQLWPQLVCSVE